jgi:polygalacturonase
LVIGANASLTSNSNLASKYVRFARGIVSRGSYNLTISKALVAPSTRLFDITGTGTIMVGATPLMDVRWFSATGDGSTNDYAALALCAAALKTRGGGTMWFPMTAMGGTYCTKFAIPLVSRVHYTGDHGELYI